jgi:hypothetical protein
VLNTLPPPPPANQYVPLMFWPVDVAAPHDE